MMCPSGLTLRRALPFLDGCVLAAVTAHAGGRPQILHPAALRGTLFMNAVSGAVQAHIGFPEAMNVALCPNSYKRMLSVFTGACSLGTHGLPRPLCSGWRAIVPHAINPPFLSNRVPAGFIAGSLVCHRCTSPLA